MTNTDPHVAIIGAGIGGICMAIALRKALPSFNDFTIYEKASDIGGTWRNGTYPGCASDIGINYYTHSEELKYDWTRSHASQPEILAYWRALVLKYDLGPRIILNTKVVSAHWDKENEHYLITMQNTQSGEETQKRVKAVVAALGVSEVPKLPNISGRSEFRGSSFHASRWEQGMRLSGKRVAVVGSGSSATQLITTISADSSVKVTQFAGSPNWYLPNTIEDFGPVRRFAYRHVPLCARLARFGLWVKWDIIIFEIMFKMRWIHPLINRLAAAYIRQMAPKQYQNRLIPSYTFGAKRVIHDTEYLEALHRANVDINWDRLKSIESEGIVTGAGEHIPFDVIVYATGYIADDFFIDVRGVEKSVQEYYREHGGPYAFKSVALPGFPNFFMLTGPNSVNGSTPLTFSLEVHANYVTQLVSPIIAREVSFVAPSKQATDEYNVRIQDHLKKTIWMETASWYRTDDGHGRLTSATPYSGSYIWWMLRSVNWDEYQWGDLKSASPTWAQRLSRRRGLRFLIGTFGVGIGIIAFLLTQVHKFAPYLEDIVYRT